MERSDAFISYRRSDVQFVKKLVEALLATQRELWVDWEDIPPGVEGFSDEIQRGIEGANAFIAVLSPSYLESEYCLMELREALRLKKRIVPVVFKKFDPAPPPEGIGHINWVYFTPHAGQKNSFEDAFPKVIKALEADYEYSREHTRLLIRAIEWDKRQREQSYLLKSAEIDQAEGWQVKATGKEPPPTELHLEYILDSRKQQRIQQRRITASISVLLVLAVVAAVVAVIQARAATISAAIAHSDALASAALQPGNEDIAVALALEATRSQYAPESAYKALAQVAYPAGGIRYLIKTEENADQFLSPAASPDGRLVVIMNRLYDMETGKLVREFEDAPKRTLTGLFLPDGKRVVLAGDRDVETNSPDFIYLGLYDVSTGKLLQKYDTGIGISEVQLSADGKTLVAYQPDAKVTWWDVNTGKKLHEFEVAGSSPAFSPDLKWMAEIHSTDNSSELVITNTQTGQAQPTISNSNPGSFLTEPIRFSNDSKEIAIVESAIDEATNAIVILSVETFNVETGQALVKFKDVPQYIGSIRYSPDGTSLLMTTRASAIVTIWNRQTGTMVQQQTAHRSEVFFADYAQQGERVLSMDSNGVVMTWDLLPGNMERRLVTHESMHAITPDGRFLITMGYTSAYSPDHFTIRDAHTLEEISHLPIVGIPTETGDNSSTDSSISSYYLAQGLDNGLFTVIGNTRLSEDFSSLSAMVSVGSLANGEILRTLKTIPNVYIYKAQISPDGKEVYVQYSDQNDRNNLEAWDIASGKVTHSYVASFSGYIQFALNQDGSRLLLASTELLDETGKIKSQSLQMIEPSNAKVLFTLDEQVGTVLFNPDGTEFVLAGNSESGALKSRIRVFDSKNGKALREYTINARSGSSFEILPDGKSFMTSYGGGGGGGDGDTTPSGIDLELHVYTVSSIATSQWDFATGELIWDFSNELPEGLGSIVISPDNKRMFTSSSALAIWRFDSHDELVAWACGNRYVSEFTSAQREVFRIESDVSVCKSK